MYNLFIKGTEGPYDLGNFEFDLNRSIRAHEYTEEHLATRYGTFTDDAISELITFPAILAHEKHWNIPPTFAKITNIQRRANAGVVNISYELIDVQSSPTAEAFQGLSNSLDIAKWELNRHHWALKAVDLQAALRTIDCTFVEPIAQHRPHININNHRFNIALSFPGSVRDRIEEIIPAIEREFGPNSYFYDRNYVGELARPNHDLILQSIYRERSELVIVFIGSEYAERDWCGVEWDAIRGSILDRQAEDRVMFIRTDDGTVPGVNPQDGYIHWRDFSNAELAEAIIHRYHGDRLPDPMQDIRTAEAKRLDELREELRAEIRVEALEEIAMHNADALNEERKFREED